METFEAMYRYARIYSGTVTQNKLDLKLEAQLHSNPRANEDLISSLSMQLNRLQAVCHRRSPFCDRVVSPVTLPFDTDLH